MCVGESLFKAVGGKYGEFLDFDDNTASRAKLDVARIKISTCLRGCVDDLLKIKALGVVYTIWVVEDKGYHPTFGIGSRCEEQEYSWVESNNLPAEAMVVGREFDGGSVEIVEEEDIVDLLSCQHLVPRESVQGDGDGDKTVAKEG
ncbi:hypothetical protein L195_g058846, partial [Trifolium pratense]